MKIHTSPLSTNYRDVIASIIDMQIKGMDARNDRSKRDYDRIEISREALDMFIEKSKEAEAPFEPEITIYDIDLIRDFIHSFGITDDEKVRNERIALLKDDISRGRYDFNDATALTDLADTFASKILGLK